jgi:hypothetical protein
METISAHWIYDDYLVFLLLHCGFADTELTEKEEEQLEHHASHHLIKRIKKVYANTNPEERLAVIKTFKDKFCHSAAGKEDAIYKAKQIFTSDANFSSSEEALLAELEQIIRS